MTVVEKPDPRRKIFLAAGIDGLAVIIGVVLFMTTGSVAWLIGSVILGAAAGLPLILSAIREMKEQNNASG